MDFDTPASTWMPSQHRQPVVTLTFDRRNPARSSIGAIECSL